MNILFVRALTRHRTLQLLKRRLIILLEDRTEHYLKGSVLDCITKLSTVKWAVRDEYETFVHKNITALLHSKNESEIYDEIYQTE